MQGDIPGLQFQVMEFQELDKLLNIMFISFHRIMRKRLLKLEKIPETLDVYGPTQLS
jgi:hypothetical protein